VITARLWLRCDGGGFYSIRMVKRQDPPKSLLKRLVRPSFSRAAGAGLEAKQIAQLILTTTLAQKRKRITKAAQGSGGDPVHNAAVRRFAKDRARALKRELSRNRRLTDFNRALLMRNRIPSPLLDALDPDRQKRWKKIISRRYRKDYRRLQFSNFNFLDDPVGTIQSFRDLSIVDCEEVNAHIDFEDQICQDIGSFLVFAEVWKQLSPIYRGGKMAAPVQKVLDAVGLRKEMGIGLLGLTGRDGIWPFEIRRRRTRGTTHSPTALLGPQQREQLNDALISLIDEWLGVASNNATNVPDGIEWGLTQDGKANIANMVGEILDNAERHSVAGGDGDWTMAAFMMKAPGEKSAMRCHLAFLSVGRSIAEALATAPEYMRTYCEGYARGHAKCGRSRDTLVTIVALQDGVTSSHSAHDGNRGGTGLQDTLDLVGGLAGAPDPNADVAVTIVSGKSCIRLRHPTLVGRRDGKDRRVQWCNAANDPQYPPDADVAFDLPAHFAGTLVSVAFTLDPGLFVPGDSHDGQADD
jgi:hypothetical protein